MALAVAWAAYLIPKALQHHDEVVRSRSVDRFSHRMRVLARREPVNGRNARLVVTPGSCRGTAGGHHEGLRRSPTRALVARPVAARHASAPSRPRRPGAGHRRRRRGRRLPPHQLVVDRRDPGRALLVAWLVACRLMVRAERGIRADVVRSRARGRGRPRDRAGRRGRLAARGHDGLPAGGPVVVDAPIDPRGLGPAAGDPADVRLQAGRARRTVRTIDLDSTGVWSSGRSESDTALAREADEAERARGRAAWNVAA